MKQNRHNGFYLVLLAVLFVGGHALAATRPASTPATGEGARQDKAAGRAPERADGKVEGWRLTYQEKESGVDPYEVRMLVSRRFIRIDIVDDDSGYIVYDDARKTIYSLSHYDKKILVIHRRPFSSDDSGVRAQVEYLALSDAPTVAGKPVFNYRQYVSHGKQEETCAELQIAEGLLPEVAQILKRYQQVVSGEQTQLLKRTIEDVQTDCYLADQIYNDGRYYDHGLPIHEWHSNEKSRSLLSYKKIMIDPKVFALPGNYRHFSITQPDLSGDDAQTENE